MNYYAAVKLKKDFVDLIESQIRLPVCGICR
jgi:hypothetical protein